jgi:hypothetical protein
VPVASGSAGGGPQKNNNKTLIVIGAVLAALITVGVVAGVAVALSSSSKHSSSSDNPPSTDTFTPVTDAPTTPSGGGSAADAKVTVDPDVGLSDGDTMSIDATGLDSDTDYEIEECVQTTDNFLCDGSTLSTKHSDENGEISASYTATQNLNYKGTAYDCSDVETQCALTVGTEGGATVVASDTIDFG